MSIKVTHNVLITPTISLKHNIHLYAWPHKVEFYEDRNIFYKLIKEQCKWCSFKEFSDFELRKSV